jgi:hypothetical protein
MLRNGKASRFFGPMFSCSRNGGVRLKPKEINKNFKKRSQALIDLMSLIERCEK